VTSSPCLNVVCKWERITVSDHDQELRRVALEIARWAEAKRMMGSYGVDPDYDESTIYEMFRGVGLQTAITTLQDRSVSYIGINEADNSVVIFTNRPLRAKDRGALAKAGSSAISVEFRHASQLSSGSPAPGAAPVPPYVLTPRDHYTCGSSISIANEAGSAGTLGCLLTDAADGVFALSNNHVFAGNNYADLGIQLMVPGQADIAANNLDPFVLGHLVRALPLVDGNPHIVSAATNIDAAIMRVSAPDRVSSLQRNYYDTPSTVAPLAANMAVEKVGRTTGRTLGKVVSHHIVAQPIRANIQKIGSFKVVFFVDFWGIVGDGSAFSKGGDSGSLVTSADPNGTRQAVGIVFAGDDNLSLALSLDRVLQPFGLTVLSGHNI
jgi:hypothetical protein